ncbi:hypothetical protein ABK040_012839 [Willaertia magna]
MKIEYGDNLQTFSSLSATVNLVKLIQLINVPKNQDTFIYGNRKFTIDIYDKNQHSTGDYYLDLCRKDKFCFEIS